MPLTRDFAPGDPRSRCLIVFSRICRHAPVSRLVLLPVLAFFSVWILGPGRAVSEAGSPSKDGPTGLLSPEENRAAQPRALASLASSEDDEDDEAEDEQEAANPAEDALLNAVYAHQVIPAHRTRRTRQNNRGGPTGPDREERVLESEQRFTEISELYPDTRAAAEALYWIAECQRMLEDFEIALETYGKALATNGGGAQGGGIRLGTARCKIALGHFEEGLTFLDDIQKNYIEGHEVIAALYFRGVAFRELERYSEAEQAWSELESEYPGDPHATNSK